LLVVVVVEDDVVDLFSTSGVVLRPPNSGTKISVKTAATLAVT
jgi:hypothetical protein